MARAQKRESVVERDEAGLTQAQHKLIRASRDTMQMTIWQGAKRDDRLSLLAVAISGFFVDFVMASTATPEVLAAVNTQLRNAGLQVVPLQRN